MHFIFVFLGGIKALSAAEVAIGFYLHTNCFGHHPKLMAVGHLKKFPCYHPFFLSVTILIPTINSYKQVPEQELKKQGNYWYKE